MRSRLFVVVSIQCSEANFALLDHASADKMGPLFDFFENLRDIFSNDTDREKVQGTKKEHGHQQCCYASRSRLRKKQFGKELHTHEDTGEAKQNPGNRTQNIQGNIGEGVDSLFCPANVLQEAVCGH